ncbi:MAG: YesL family protein [Hespellia sp.]|nr:YesL family protein [Hespellia sp.]
MNKLFQAEGPIFSFLGKVSDIIILNIIFLIGCIPIITIGASLTALITTASKCICRDEGYLFETFRKVFISSFKKSTLTFILLAIMTLIFYVDILYVQSVFSSPFRQIFTVLFLSVAIVLFLISEYLFFCIGTGTPYSSSENDKPLRRQPLLRSFKEDIKKASLLSIGCLPYTLLITLINLLPVLITLISGALYTGLLAVYIFFGFALTAALDGFFILKAYTKIISGHSCQNESHRDQE